MSLRTLFVVAGLLLAAGQAPAQTSPPSAADNAPPAHAVQVAQAMAGDSVRPATGASGSTGHLAVRGQDIVDPNGRPLLLRGWNWGHWGKAVEADAADNASQGANVVRLPLRWWGYYKGHDIDSRNDSAPALVDPAHLRMLDDNIRWASRAHLWIILFIDSDCGQDGTQEGQPAYCDPHGQYRNGHNFWTDPNERAKFIALWRFIANRYKDTPYLGLFEPLPEPGHPGIKPAEITAFYTEVMAAIRSVAPGIPFLLGPTRYHAAQIDASYNPAWKDVVYTGDLFLHENTENGEKESNVGNLHKRLQKMLDFRAQHNVPLFVQQVGVKQGRDPDRSQLRTVLNDLNSNRVGFAYWEYRGAQNADQYGVFFQQGREWKVKPDVLNTITSSFKK